MPALLRIGLCRRHSKASGQPLEKACCINDWVTSSTGLSLGSSAEPITKLDAGSAAPCHTWTWSPLWARPGSCVLLGTVAALLDMVSLSGPTRILNAIHKPATPDCVLTVFRGVAHSSSPDSLSSPMMQSSCNCCWDLALTATESGPRKPGGPLPLAMHRSSAVCAAPVGFPRQGCLSAL